MKEAKALGLPLEFSYKGKTYKLANPITFEIEGLFAMWCVRDAMDEVERHRALFNRTNGELGLEDSICDRMCDRITDQVAGGEFRWGGTIVNTKLTRSWDGVKMMILLRFRAYHPNFSQKLIDEIFADIPERERLSELLSPKKEEGEEETEAETAESSGGTEPATTTKE